MPNWAEHEIYPANYCWHFNIHQEDEIHAQLCSAGKLYILCNLIFASWENLCSTTVSIKKTTKKWIQDTRRSSRQRRVMWIYNG